MIEHFEYEVATKNCLADHTLDCCFSRRLC